MTVRQLIAKILRFCEDDLTRQVMSHHIAIGNETECMVLEGDATEEATTLAENNPNLMASLHRAQQ